MTSGNLTITLVGVSLDRVARAPLLNSKTFLTKPDSIYLEAKDMSQFTDWGIVELKPIPKAKEMRVEVMIDSESWGWYGSAQIALVKDGQVIASENFQSGTKGPVGNPKRYRSYPVLGS
jgi:hypothetical protein